MLVAALSPSAAHADTIAGRASVIDGDTLEIRGERIRILDIDAPESRQTCQDGSGADWRCGQKAGLALADWIGQRTVTCVTDKLDKYHRHLAHCTVAFQDMGQWMAAQGWAVPYRDCKCEVIQDAANAAKVAKRGVWSGTFTMPWDWRAQQAKQIAPEQSAEQPTVIKPDTSQGAGGCLIKGNINSKGEHIYHVPGGAWYDKTKIDTRRGERWFCSEAEAQAAGWRPSKQ
jgi:endonuclease YncB( thermonuclease family)